MHSGAANAQWKSREVKRVKRKSRKMKRVERKPREVKRVKQNKSRRKSAPQLVGGSLVIVLPDECNVVFEELSEGSSDVCVTIEGG